MGAKEQKFLLDNSFNDLCLNRATVDYHGDKRGYIYVSDVMETYVREVARQQIRSRRVQLITAKWSALRKWLGGNFAIGQTLVAIKLFSGDYNGRKNIRTVVERELGEFRRLR